MGATTRALERFRRWEDDGGSLSPMVSPRAEAGSMSSSAVSFLGTYSPRRCGIATFTEELSRAVLRWAPRSSCSVVAVTDPDRTYAYPAEVAQEVEQDVRSAYLRAAEVLNAGPTDVVCLQHEYGIFGGNDGEHALALLERLRMPVVTTLHTILMEPSHAQRAVMQEVCSFSERLVVMSGRGADTLSRRYRVPSTKIDVIPHGTVAAGDRARSKISLGLSGRPVLLTLGLLSPAKGIEYAVEALVAVAQRYPNVAYLVVGCTHPHVRAEHGESYRRRLAARAVELGVEGSVVFYDRFVSREELVEFLSAADLYLTPYLDSEQSSSGALAYAVGSGRAVISTPYPHARELLEGGRGTLVPARNAQAIADAVLDLLGDRRKRTDMELRAGALSASTGWENVARKYLAVFERAIRTHAARPRGTRSEHRSTLRVPSSVNLRHLRAMTDGTGLLQHATFHVPRYRAGYCLDDNARALLLLTRHRAARARPRRSSPLAARYLAFVDHAFDDRAGRFRNFLSYTRQWSEAAGSEDSHGRALWALGAVAGHSPVYGERELAKQLFERALPTVASFSSPRAWAYTLLGIAGRHPVAIPQGPVEAITRTLSERLLDMFLRESSDSWPWGESVLSYCNARLPEALIAIGDRLGHRQMVATGLRSLRWLDQVQTGPSGMFAAVGSNGFYPSNGSKAAFDQQPVEACATVSACLLAHRTTGDPAWHDRAMVAFEWFLGRNHLGRPVYDRHTGGCRDGVHEDRLNENQGAESTLSFLTALVDVHSSARRDVGEERALETRESEARP